MSHGLAKLLQDESHYSRNSIPPCEAALDKLMYKNKRYKIEKMHVLLVAQNTLHVQFRHLCTKFVYFKLLADTFPGHSCVGPGGLYRLCSSPLWPQLFDRLGARLSVCLRNRLIGVHLCRLLDLIRIFQSQTSWWLVVCPFALLTWLLQDISLDLLR